MSKKFDTIVVPCKDSKRDNNKMLDNGYWAGVKIAESRKNKLKYIAIYHTAPTSEITECYRIKFPIESWNEQDSSKCKIFFDKASCEKLNIKYNGDKSSIMRASRYTQHDRCKNAKNLKELFYFS